MLAKLADKGKLRDWGKWYGDSYDVPGITALRIAS